MRATTKLALGVLNFYQHRISPHKGYSCAFRVWHEDISCSEYAKLVISQQGVTAVLPKLYRRLCDCRKAFSVMQESGQETSRETNKGSSTTSSQSDVCANVCAMPCL